MMRFAITALVVFLSAPAFAAVAEDVNPAKITYLYYIQDGMVQIRQCPGEPALDIDAGSCVTVTTASGAVQPLTREAFAGRVNSWAVPDLENLARAAALAKELIEQRRGQLFYLQERIHGLPEGSPLLADYRAREQDLVASIAKLEAKVVALEAQFNGYDLVFAEDGLLAQDLIHPVLAGGEGYTAARPYIAHFAKAFLVGENAAADQGLAAVTSDMQRWRGEGKNPYCVYWQGTHVGPPEREETVIRTLVSLGRQATLNDAKQSCEQLGMKIPDPDHIPAYHSRLWIDGVEEIWSRAKSVGLFAQTDLARNLPTLQFDGVGLKIFWIAMLTPRAITAYDAFYMSPSGEWFSYPGVAQDPRVRPDWHLSVVCEKEYPRLERLLAGGELQECTKYRGLP